MGWYLGPLVLEEVNHSFLWSRFGTSSTSTDLPLLVSSLRRCRVGHPRTRSHPTPTDPGRLGRDPPGVRPVVSDVWDLVGVQRGGVDAGRRSTDPGVRLQVTVRETQKTSRDTSPVYRVPVVERTLQVVYQVGLLSGGPHVRASIRAPLGMKDKCLAGGGGWG